jgi:hypothetical protein
MKNFVRGGVSYHFQDGDIPQRASGGRIIGARTQSEVGLAELPPGVHFRCGECAYMGGKRKGTKVRLGECGNPNAELFRREVHRTRMCCNLYDHDGMKVIV